MYSICGSNGCLSTPLWEWRQWWEIYELDPVYIVRMNNCLCVMNQEWTTRSNFQLCSGWNKLLRSNRSSLRFRNVALKLIIWNYKYSQGVFHLDWTASLTSVQSGCPASCDPVHTLISYIKVTTGVNLNRLYEPNPYRRLRYQAPISA